MQQRRIAITGLGVISGFGLGADRLWQGMCQGHTAIRPIQSFDPAGFETVHAAEATDFNAKDHVPKTYRKSIKIMARDIELAVGAAMAVTDDAGIATRMHAEDRPPTYASERMGCQIGAGLIAAEARELATALVTSTVPSDVYPETGQFSWNVWGDNEDAGGGGKMNNLPPLWLLKYLPNMLACHVTILHGLEGPSNTILCGEASGPLCIGEASRVIERGDADLCFAGGIESKVNRMGLVRMRMAGRLAASTADTDPAAVVRPYDAQAPGTLLGEGGAVLTLEALDMAESRGARIYAELIGFGGGHSPLPIPGLHLGGVDSPEEDAGLTAAILNALDDADIAPDQIDAIVPAALGVAALDRAEAGSLHRVFSDRLADIPLITTKPNVGDTSAGAGAIQAAVAAMALHEQKLPARVHSGQPAAGLQAGAAQATSAQLKHVLICTNALGGQNAALVLRKHG